MTIEIAFPQFNQATHCLGSLCRQNHDYNHTGHSMRYIKSGECVICMKLKRRRYFKPDKGKAMCNRASRTDASKKRSPDYQKTDRGKTTHKKSRLKYLQTEKGKLLKRRAEHARRSTMPKTSANNFTPSQLKAHFKTFGNVCAYCGSTSRITIDHVTPVSKGGAHELNNIVPCCKRCNSSKCASDIQSWYTKQTFFDPHKLTDLLNICISNYQNQQTSLESWA